MRRWILGGATAVIAVLLAAGVVYYLHEQKAARDIRGSSTVEFVPTTPPPPKPREPNLAWPMYGHDPERLRVATGITLTPPFRRVWMFRARSLVEFPPAVAYNRLYFANNYGVLYAISAKTGKRAWRYVSDRCQAMSPAVGFDTVYAVFLNHQPCNARGRRQGQLVALWAGSGKVRWRKTIGPSESSPLLQGKVVYVGDWNGVVSAYSATTGRRWWSFRVHGKVKGGLAYSGGKVFFGAYDSHVYALDAVTGKLVWKAKAQPRTFGRTGRFYATPAVAYDRVYIGATDGKMYSFGAETGKLRWSQSTQGFVYSSPAVWRKRIYVGAYNGGFFCMDAATGDIKWEFIANGPISGSPTILAGRVYFSTLKGRTYALNAVTGKELWTFPDGKYSPVVADENRLYLVGHTRLYGLQEKGRVVSKNAVRRHGRSRIHRVAPRRSAHPSRP
jgi:outer membrane protein assembly factor BamB